MLSITKLQNLKAIHNKALRAFLKWRSCYQSQNYKIWKQFITIHLVKHNKHVVVINYKIWKQFTTSIHKGKPTRLLLSIIKLQNLKAIHNGLFYRNYLYFVVINHNTIKFESNSQLFFIQISLFSRCYQSQNHKIWKQFTTLLQICLKSLLLLSITTLQNLKAIHNCHRWRNYPIWVVINHKITKFESNSQLLLCS